MENASVLKPVLVSRDAVSGVEFDDARYPGEDSPSETGSTPSARRTPSSCDLCGGLPGCTTNLASSRSSMGSERSRAFLREGEELVEHERTRVQGEDRT
jgi:hypothetical protein